MARCASSRSSDAVRNPEPGRHRESRPHDKMPVTLAKAETRRISRSDRIARNNVEHRKSAEIGSNETARSASDHLLTRPRVGPSVLPPAPRSTTDARRLVLSPWASPSLRGFLLPRFVNAGRPTPAANVALRPASKNLQESRSSDAPRLRSARGRVAVVASLPILRHRNNKCRSQIHPPSGITTKSL